MRLYQRSASGVDLAGSLAAMPTTKPSENNINLAKDPEGPEYMMECSRNNFYSPSTYDVDPSIQVIIYILGDRPEAHYNPIIAVSHMI